MRKPVKNSWKDVKKDHDNLLKIFPHLKSNGKTKYTLNMMALWNYSLALRNQKRFVELIWIQANLIEITINSMLSSYFFVKNNIQYKKANKFIVSLNFYEKNNLLFLLNIITEDAFNKLERYRKLRNVLIHKLMERIKSGENLETLCKTTCEIGFELQKELHDAHPGWKFAREGKL